LRVSGPRWTNAGLMIVGSGAVRAIKVVKVQVVMVRLRFGVVGNMPIVRIVSLLPLFTATRNWRFCTLVIILLVVILRIFLQELLKITAVIGTPKGGLLIVVAKIMVSIS